MPTSIVGRPLTSVVGTDKTTALRVALLLDNSQTSVGITLQIKTGAHARADRGRLGFT